MVYRSLILALLALFLSFLSQTLSSALHSPTPALHSPTPASSPTHQPASLAAHAPPIFRHHRQQFPPPPHRRRRRSPLPPPPPGKLNLGKKLGLLFAAIAVVLQVTFAAFLIYKRWQLKKMGRRYRTGVSS